MIRPNIKPRTLLAITFIAVQAGCKSDSPTAPIDQISHIVPLGSLDYTGTVGTIVSPAPAVRLTDRNGRPVANVDVSFLMVGGGNAATGTHSATDADGTQDVL